MTQPWRDRLITWLCRRLAGAWDLLARAPADLPAEPRILILKPCCLGDVLMTTPAIAALRAGLPAAHIDFAVGPWSRPMLERNPHIERLIDAGRVGSGPYALADWRALVGRIRAGRYDLCLIPDRSPALTLLPAGAGIPRRVGLDSDGRGFSLTQRVPAGGIQHEVDLYLACVAALGLPTAGARLEFYPSPAARQNAASLTPAGAGPLVVVHPAGGQNPGMTLSAKRWPAARFAALIGRLQTEQQARVIVVGGKDDIALTESICQAAGGAPTNLAGRLSFDELGALLEGAQLFIGNDTGAMHLAVAAGAPTVAIFGPSDPRQYGPYGSGHRAIWNQPACAPCLARGRWNTACRDFRCIESVTPEQVWAAAIELLS